MSFTTYKNGKQRPEYYAWRNMIRRCYDINTERYVHYGARGITVCDRWLTFENFFLDMGERPTDGHSIDRINNDGNYEPSNCKWSTFLEQSYNKRSNIWIEHNGIKRTITQWAKAIGIDRKTLSSRIYESRWPIEKALDHPKKSRTKVDKIIASELLQSGKSINDVSKILGCGYHAIYSIAKQNKQAD